MWTSTIYSDLQTGKDDIFLTGKGTNNFIWTIWTSQFDILLSWIQLMEKMQKFMKYLFTPPVAEEEVYVSYLVSLPKAVNPLHHVFLTKRCRVGTDNWGISIKCSMHYTWRKSNWQYPIHVPTVDTWWHTYVLGNEQANMLT